MSWKETRAALRREVERGNDGWQRTRARHAALAAIETTADLARRLADGGGADWTGRRATAQALLVAHQEEPSSLLSSVLVLAYWPLLSSLCGRARSSMDREQIALTSFVLALAECDPARGIDSLAWRTRRHFFRALRVEATPRFDELFEVEDPSASAEDAVVLRDALRTIEERDAIDMKRTPDLRFVFDGVALPVDFDVPAASLMDDRDRSDDVRHAYLAAQRPEPYSREGPAGG